VAVISLAMLHSPWRLARPVTARWYQWAREASTERDAAQLEELQAALCKSAYAFHQQVGNTTNVGLLMVHARLLDDLNNSRHRSLGDCQAT